MRSIANAGSWPIVAHLLYEVTNERRSGRKFQMVYVAIQELVQSEHTLCHGKPPLDGLQDSLICRCAEVRLVQIHAGYDNERERQLSRGLIEGGYVNIWPNSDHGQSTVAFVPGAARGDRPLHALS